MRPFESRYAKEADYADFEGRLHVYGLDMRDLPTLESFTEHYASTYPFLDVIVNNACQVGGASSSVSNVHRPTVCPQ